MEELLAKHRREKKDLQGRVTQKKKAASKKTRKGVNDECERLERELQTQHEAEIAALNGTSVDEAAESKDLSEEVEETAGTEANDDIKSENGPSSLDSDMTHLSVSESSAGKKPNRQKARLARRAAEQSRIAEEAAAEAAQMPDHKKEERETMVEAFKKRGLEEKLVRADGHCLYAAVADQLRTRGDDVNVQGVNATGDDYRIIRYVAADQIAAHSDDYVPFLEEDLDTYVTKVRDTGEWGGQIELMALSKAYNSKICVLQGDGTVTDIGEGPDEKTMWLAYYRHNFGLGEHYNSLRKPNDKP
jgi:OTU domain-containing protein 6